MKLTNEEIQKIEQLLRDSSYAKYHKRLQIIYFRSKEKCYSHLVLKSTLMIQRYWGLPLIKLSLSFSRQPKLAQWDSNLVNKVVEVRKSVYLECRVHPRCSWDEN